MYSARISTDNGDVFYFGYIDLGWRQKFDSVFDIDPLTGIDVDLATSQGYQQIGETVEGQSVGGVNRTIKGVFIKNAATEAADMLKMLPIFTTGKLFYMNDNDAYFCEIVVKKTPQIYTDKNGITHFSILVFCPTPFWYKSQRNIYHLTAYPAVNCKNNGVAQMEFSIEFQTDRTIYSFWVQNLTTNKRMDLSATLQPGEKITVYRKNGRLYVTKNITEDIFSALDENSDFFELASGDNELLIGTPNSMATLTATVEFYEPYMGVINATD